MTEIPSPISGAPSFILSELRTRDLCRLYNRDYGIDVSRHFLGVDRLQYRECSESGVRFFYPLCPADDQCYAELSQIPWYYDENKEEYRYAGARLTAASSVLDVGCGVGKFATAVPHAHFVGLEFSASAVRSAQEAGLTIFCEPLKDHARDNADTYDGVTAFQVLEHVTDPIGFLKDMVVCARPGGLVIVSVPAEDGALGASINYTLNLPPHHLTHWTDRALIFAMTQVGLLEVSLHHLLLNSGEEVEAITQFMARALGGRNFHKKLIRMNSMERLFFALLRVAAKRLRRGIVVPFARGHTVLAIGRKPPQ